MFDNVGKTLKTVASIFCILGVLASIIGGVMLIVQSNRYNPTATAGWIILIAGSLGSWISALFMYGFGELIEKTCENNEILQRMEKRPSTGKKDVPAEPASQKEPAQIKAESVSPAPEAKASKPESAAAPVPDNRVNDVTDDMLQQVKNMATAGEIYNYIVLTINNAALLHHLERNARLEKVYGNYKVESITCIEGYIKHGHKAFPVDHSGRKIICPVCGCEQKSDRSTCKSCSALFEISKDY